MMVTDPAGAGRLSPLTLSRANRPRALPLPTCLTGLTAVFLVGGNHGRPMPRLASNRPMCIYSLAMCSAGTCPPSRSSRRMFSSVSMISFRSTAPFLNCSFSENAFVGGR
jgi:hypothetical protein